MDLEKTLRNFNQSYLLEGMGTVVASQHFKGVNKKIAVDLIPERGSYIEKVTSIKLIIAPKWKYDFIRLFKVIIEKTRNPGEIMKAILSKDEFKRYGQDISKLIPAFMKDPAKLPQTLLEHDDELKRINETKEYLEKLFSCSIIVEEAESSKEGKAKSAMPGKPGIVLQ